MRLLMLAGLSLFAAPATSATLLMEDFDGATVSGAIGGAGTVESVQGYAGDPGFSGHFLRNTGGGDPAQPTTVSLTGLGAHSTVTVGFSLALIETWDLTTNLPFGPDFLTLTADGTEIFTLTVDEILGVAPQPSYLTAILPNNDRGFETTADERGGRVEISFAHSASSLNLALFASGTGWQGAPDESWAIDNLTITADIAPVPLPASGLLLAFGLGGLAVTRRWTRKT